MLEKWKKIDVDESQYAWLVPGTLVDYHGIIHGPITAKSMEVLSRPWIDANGIWVTNLCGKAGVVAAESLTPSQGEARPQAAGGGMEKEIEAIQNYIASSALYYLEEGKPGREEKHDLALWGLNRIRYHFKPATPQAPPLPTAGGCSHADAGPSHEPAEGGTMDYCEVRCSCGLKGKSWGYDMRDKAGKANAEYEAVHWWRENVTAALPMGSQPSVQGKELWALYHETGNSPIETKRCLAPHDQPGKRGAWEWVRMVEAQPSGAVDAGKGSSDSLNLGKSEVKGSGEPATGTGGTGDDLREAMKEAWIACHSASNPAENNRASRFIAKFPKSESFLALLATRGAPPKTGGPKWYHIRANVEKQSCEVMITEWELLNSRHPAVFFENRIREVIEQTLKDAGAAAPSQAGPKNG